MSKRVSVVLEVPRSVAVETRLSQSAYKFHESYLILKYV